MATGASTADLAILLVDATKGLLTQTRRHAVIVSLLGIRNVVLAVNKMDLVGFDEATFRAIVADFASLRREALASTTIVAIPISARAGDNVSRASARTPWYSTARCCSSISRRSTLESRGRVGPVPPAGAMGLPAEPEFPRLCRDRRLRPRRRSATRSSVAASGRTQPHRPHPARRRRSATGRRRRRSRSW